MKTKAGLLLLLLASAPAHRAGAQTDLQPRIANGTPTTEYPEVGVFLTDNASCTATLIGCRTALTAAHCVCDPSGDGAACGASLDQGTDKVVDPTNAAFFLPLVGYLPITSIQIPSNFYFGEQGDVAILELDTQTRAIRPRQINQFERPPVGTAGFIVGFGEDVAADSGLKRIGSVVTTSCTVPDGGVPAATNVCWNPTSSSAQNTCPGDSGGPLLANLGAGLTVVGTTSGGVATGCQGDGFSFDADVFVLADWMIQQTGVDLASAACGDGPQVGDAAVTTASLSGVTSSQAVQSFSVPAGTKLLRVGLNGTDSVYAALYLGPGAPPTTTNAACASTEVFTASFPAFEYCEVPDPTPGTWYALVSASGTYSYQLTVASLPEDPPPPPLASGWMLTSSFTSNEMVEVDPADGSRAVVASRLRGSGADLADPEGIALDGAGGLLVANPLNLNLLRVNLSSGDRQVVSGCADAACSSTVGTGPAFFAPRFIAVGPDGLLVADRSNPGTYAIVRVDPSTGDRTVVSGCSDPSCAAVVGNGPAISRLFGIRQESSGQIVVVDGQAVYQIDPTTGDRTFLTGCSNASCANSDGQPGDLVIDPSGALFVTYRIEGTPFGAVRRIDGTTLETTQVSGCTDVTCSSVRGTGPDFIDPFGVELAPDSALLVADGGLEAIVRVDPTTGDRTPISGCSDSTCQSAVGSGPGFADTLGLAVVPEPASGCEGLAALAALVAAARARRCGWSAVRSA